MVVSAVGFQGRRKRVTLVAAYEYILRYSVRLWCCILHLQSHMYVYTYVSSKMLAVTKEATIYMFVRIPIWVYVTVHTYVSGNKIVFFFFCWPLQHQLPVISSSRIFVASMQNQNKQVEKAYSPCFHTKLQQYICIHVYRQCTQRPLSAKAAKLREFRRTSTKIYSYKALMACNGPLHAYMHTNICAYKYVYFLLLRLPPCFCCLLCSLHSLHIAHRFR